MLLFILQFLLCVVLIGLGWRGVAEGPLLWIGILTGAAVLLSGVLAMRLRQVRVTPMPGARAVLCRRGPYRFIRHPMYSGQLLAFAMFACGERGVAGALAWLALAIVLWIKIEFEERFWLVRDPEYADYRRATKRLIPWIL